MRSLLLLLPLTVFAGQSLVLTPGATGSIADPYLPQNQSWRVEFQLHDWTVPPQGVYSAYLFYLGGTGLNALIYPDGRLALNDVRDSVRGGAPCLLSLSGRQNVLVRFQRDVSNMRTVCEVWNADGTGYQQNSNSFSLKSFTSNGGGTLGSANTNASLGFLRVMSTIVADGSRPPVTADSGDSVDLTFDSSAGVSGTLASAASYVPTPGQNPVAFVKTLGAPAWSNWVSLRAGFPAQLDGSQSFSLADGSSAVSYQWTQVSGPTTLRWSDTTSATPTIEGLIFGTYQFQLTVKDTTGNTASTTFQVGAVSTDANGVVVQADPNADKLFGPMIAFGQNPWGYADERAIRATALRSAAYDNQGLSNPTWEQPLAGTVTYKFSPAYTNLSADVSSSSMSIQVNDVSQFDLATFPTRIVLGNAAYGASEEVRICSATGSTLNVCYDGRGWRSGSYKHMVASAWNKGTYVYQDKVSGTGTQFLTDFCPAGLGWSGPISYQDGMVTVTPGSSGVIGIGTSWANTNAGGRAIRIEGTHNGNAFVFHAYIASVNGASSLTLNRPWPSDADLGSFKYALINADTRNLTPHYVRKDGTDGIIYFPTSGCESDNALYLNGWWDNGITGVQTDKQYAYMDGMGYVGDFGPNFYDEVLAHYALYYRSGWAPARDAARKIGDNWLDYPEIANGDAGGTPRRMSITGAVANTVLDGRTKNWSGLRTLANRGVAASSASCDDDLRENAYAMSWLAFAALFDPVDTGSATEPNQRSYWKSKLADAAVRDAACGGTDHSWKSGEFWSAGAYPALTVTNGSAVATGTNLPTAMCPYVASGTGVATANAAVITGTGFIAGAKILITGTRFGQPYTGGFEFRVDNPYQVSLPVLWPGDSGSISWMVETNLNFSTIAVDNVNDSRFGQVWGCRWDSASQITLNRPWVGTGTETVHLFRYNLVGRGTQPFMLGIKTAQMNWASLVDDAATASSYRDLASGAASWILSEGYDPLLKAVSYGRIFPQCEPPMTESGDPTFAFRIPGCFENSANPSYVSMARARNAEVQNAIRVAYQSNPTDQVKALGDQAYCAQWGKAAFTKPGYCTEAITASNLDDGSLGAYKYTGFFFGMGMAHQWPAERVGGVSPAIPQTVSINLDLSQAASARVTVTQPSSATTQYTCSSSPCDVQVDARQGAHWVQIAYLSSTGQVLSTTQPDLISGTGLTVMAGSSAPQPSPSVAASPSFNVSAGTYTSTQSVTIATTTAGASIRYTTDGTTPSSTAGTVYSGPVSVSSSLTLKAIAYASGMTDSSVTTATYTITTTGSGSAWYDAAWTNRKAITIDHTKVSGAGNLTNFPMLFSVTDPKLKTSYNGGKVGKTDGTDILFTASDGVTKLDHEMEGYSGSTGQVTAWVRLPALSPTSDTVIYIYYGNTTAVDQQNTAGVWDSNYKLVWHLANGITLSGADSTGNANGSVYGGAGGGKIGGGAVGVVQNVSTGLVMGDQSRTLECWFKMTGNFGSDQVICGMGFDSGTGTAFSLMYRAAGSMLSLDVKGMSRSFPWTNDSNWHHLAVLYTGGSGIQNAALYLDGVQQATTGGTGTLVAQWPAYFDVAHSPAYPWNDMTGVVDEFRVSSTVRPAAWIASEFNNQNSPSTFLSVGAQESGSVGNAKKTAQVAPPVITPSGGSYSSTQTVTISTPTAGASIRYTTNGTTPSSTVGTLYGGPISVSSSLTLKAVAYESGMTDSSVTTVTFTIAAAGTGGGTATGGVAVNLSAAYNRSGVVTDGTSFSSGGLDQLGWAYSANLLGSTVVFNGQSFTLGPPNAPDAVSSATVALPAGQFSALTMLATGVNGNQPSQTVTVNYTDGTSSVFTQSISDWYTPQSYSGESQAVAMAHRDFSNGGMDNRTFRLYRYSFALNSAKTVRSIVLPKNINVVVLAITLTPAI